MAVFRYTARDLTGLQVQGYLHGETEQDIMTWLRDRSCTPVSIEMVDEEEKKARKSRRRRIRTEDLSSLCWQLNTMIEGGVPIAEALDTIAEDVDNGRLQEVLKDVSQHMRSGESFHASLSRHPKVFNHLFCAMIHAGESGGTMTHVLQRMADYYDRREELQRKVKRALAYPIFVVCFIVLVIMALMIFVVPRFQEIFASFGSKLPPFTLAFMAVYNAITSNIPLVMVVAVATVFFTIVFARTPLGQQQISNLLLRLPLFGKLLRFSFLAIYGKTISTLLDAGVSILDAHYIVEEMTRNSRITKALVHTRDQIAKGVGIAVSMAGTGMFPRMMTKMVQVGEESGSLPRVLDRTSDYYEKKVDLTVSTLVSVLEPALIVIVGGIVLVVLMALYLPIFSMSGMGAA